MPMTTQHKIKPQREKKFKKPKTFKTDIQKNLLIQIKLI